LKHLLDFGRIAPDQFVKPVSKSLKGFNTGIEDVRFNEQTPEIVLSLPRWYCGVRGKNFGTDKILEQLCPTTAM